MPFCSRIACRAMNICEKNIFCKEAANCLKTISAISSFIKNLNNLYACTKHIKYKLISFHFTRVDVHLNQALLPNDAQTLESYFVSDDTNEDNTNIH